MPSSLVTSPEEPIDPVATRAFAEFVRRRLRREPVAYITGRKGFRRIELAVDRRVLIPRPETELLVELALELQPRRVLDVGTGSGAIAFAIADELPDAAVVATDMYPDALEVARENAARLTLTSQVRLAHGTLASGKFDLLVANLPYVAEREWHELEPELRDWEPRGALTPGPTGLEAIDALLGELTVSPATSTNAIGLEVGEGQARHRRRPRPQSWLCRDRSQEGPGWDRSRRGRPGGGVDMTQIASITGDGAERAREALTATVASGGVAVFPADGLYGLACDPLRADAIARVHALKGRDDGKSSAVLFFSPLILRELISSLGEATREALAALLPGPVTAVVHNAERRYPLACREDPERLGIRLIESPLAGVATPLFQTSANLAASPRPRDSTKWPSRSLAAPTSPSTAAS